MSARTIDDVVRDLDEIIDYSRREQWRLGYFAALYRHVAVSFKRAVARGVFRDARRIEQLDVAFFDRFLRAVDTHRHGGEASASWQVAFDAATQWRPTVLTHLLLGMNAHIDFDLGIAVAKVVPADEMAEFEPDYEKMNVLLSRLLAVVEHDLARIWPWLGWLHRLFGTIEDGILNFSMKTARQLAWDKAQELATLTGDQRRATIEQLDGEVARVGARILSPGLLISTVFLLMRLEQHGSVAQLIDILLSDRLTKRLDQASEETITRWSETQA
jgi:hypothetical protein